MRIFLFLFLFAFHNTAFAFETKSPYAYLFDYNTGEAIYEKNTEERVYPSSMTKIMTLYVIFDLLENNKIHLSDEMVVSSSASKTPGSKMFLKAGQKVTLEELINGIAIVSGNDACVAVAENISYSEEHFAELMTQTAKKLDMYHSQFKNASGLPNNQHYSTVKDLGILSARIITDFPQHYHYFSGIKFDFNNIKQRNKNLLLGHKGVDGIKTGMTDKGGYGIVASAERDGRRLIAVINGLKSESERKFEAEKLLNYGFLHFSNHKLFQKGDTITKLDVYPNTQVETFINDDMETLFPEQFNFSVKYNKPLMGKINENDKVATLMVTNSKTNEIKEFDLLAKNSVNKPSFFATAWHNLLHKMSGTNS